MTTTLYDIKSALAGLVKSAGRLDAMPGHPSLGKYRVIFTRKQGKTVARKEIEVSGCDSSEEAIKDARKKADLSKDEWELVDVIPGPR